MKISKFSKITKKQIESELVGLSTEKKLNRIFEFQLKYGLDLKFYIDKYTKILEKENAEAERIEKLKEFEYEAYSRGIEYIAGVDEAGRGPLAGPVFAAAVILPKDFSVHGINDSKKLTRNQRETLFDIICDKALAYGIGMVDEKEIDEINIKNASIKAMEIAVSNLQIVPELILVDSERLRNTSVEQISIIKGDMLSISIASASILAKVTRDRYIESMDSIYPQYGFAKHKGYGTKAHIEAIRKHGICSIHRKTFTKTFVSDVDK